MDNYGQNSPALTATLPDFVTAGGGDNLTYRNFSIIDIKNNIEIVDHCVLDDYLDDLKRCSGLVELDYEQQRRYKYSPDLLAYDAYQSTQLDFVILLLYGAASPTDFTPTKILLPTKSILFAFLTQVYNSESEILENKRNLGLW